VNITTTWTGRRQPNIEEAIAEVREHAQRDGTPIPEGLTPRIVRLDPSEGEKHGSLQVIFEWDEGSPAE
jgi:hypothetical protein